MPFPVQPANAFSRTDLAVMNQYHGTQHEQRYPVAFSGAFTLVPLYKDRFINLDCN